MLKRDILGFIYSLCIYNIYYTILMCINIKKGLKFEKKRFFFVKKDILGRKGLEPSTAHCY